MLHRCIANTEISVSGAQSVNWVTKRLQVMLLLVFYISVWMVNHSYYLGSLDTQDTSVNQLFIEVCIQLSVVRLNMIPLPSHLLNIITGQSVMNLPWWSIFYKFADLVLGDWHASEPRYSFRIAIMWILYSLPRIICQLCLTFYIFKHIIFD